MTTSYWRTLATMDDGVPSINNQKKKKLQLCCGDSSCQDHITNRNSSLLAQFHSQGSAGAGTRHSTHTHRSVRAKQTCWYCCLLAQWQQAMHAWRWMELSCMSPHQLDRSRSTTTTTSPIQQQEERQAKRPPDRSRFKTDRWIDPLHMQLLDALGTKKKKRIG